MIKWQIRETEELLQATKNPIFIKQLKRQLTSYKALKNLIEQGREAK